MLKFDLRTAHRIDPSIALTIAHDRHLDELPFYAAQGNAVMMWGTEKVNDGLSEIEERDRKRAEDKWV